MSRSAIEHGPAEDDERCTECNGSGDCHDDFGSEWTCTECAPEPNPCDVPPLWISDRPYRTCDCHFMQRARLELVWK